MKNHVLMIFSDMIHFEFKNILLQIRADIY